MFVKKNWSEPRCLSGKGVTISLAFGFRCRLTMPKSQFSLFNKISTGNRMIKSITVSIFLLIAL